MQYGKLWFLKFQFEINIRKSIRLIESTDNKVINAELDLLFNETYEKQNILRRHTDIDIYIYTFKYTYIYIHIYIYIYYITRIYPFMTKASLFLVYKKG